jgi:sigma-E factor negative regulatory protein RseA
MDMTDNHEQVSALADGELRGEAFARAVAATAGSASAREAWHAYHLIGESLRHGRPAAGRTPHADFLAKLQQRLQDEPAPRAVFPVAPAAPSAVRPATAANDGWWKLAAGVASVAAVAAISWSVMAPGAPAQPVIAVAPAAAPANVVPVAATARPEPMLRDARLDQLLAAHRQLGGATALHNTSGFLRNATFEGAGR